MDENFQEKLIHYFSTREIVLEGIKRNLFSEVHFDKEGNPTQVTLHKNSEKIIFKKSGKNDPLLKMIFN